MLRGIDRLAHRIDRRDATRRGLVMDDADSLDGVRLILAQPRFHRVGVGAASANRR